MEGRIRGIRVAGDRGVLFELFDREQVLSLQAQLAETPLAGQRDVVPAELTLLITTDSLESSRAIIEHVRGMDLTTKPELDDSLVTIEVVYTGEDLDAVSRMTGLSPDGVVAAHTDQLWTAAFGGFAPGFAYLVGENQRLAVPRRKSPRTVVPAGSIAIAGDYSAVYPRDSPGGWQLIGRTTARMWDLTRENPALVRTGNRVSFRAVRELIEPASGRQHLGDAVADGRSRAAPVRNGVLVKDPGMQSTVQDLGRSGLAGLGVAESGALDRAALRRANRLVGNPAGAAGIEALYGGLVVEAVNDQVAAVTGAEFLPTVTTPDGRKRDAEQGAPFVLRAGESLALGAPVAGIRGYLAIRGGLEGPMVLGSRSTDTMSGLGPDPLSAGQHLAVAVAPVRAVVGQPEPEPEPAASEATVPLRIILGPRADWFSLETVERFCAQTWTVTTQSNRIGLRLDGEPLERERDGELPGEGTVRGAVQIPPNGLPVLFLADHPVTGGYPVIGVVVDADQDIAAQLPAGQKVRFCSIPVPAPFPSLQGDIAHG